jgi:hypothetical protein
MTFPTVAGRNNSADSSDATSHTVALPSGTINSGDLLIVHFVVDGTPTITWPTNWVSIADRAHGDGAASKSACAYKIADGTEGASITVTTSASEKASSRSWHITGWHGTTVPEAANAAGNDAAPNPPNLSPSWGAEDTLWLALHGHESTLTSVTAYPTNYVNTFGQGTSGGSGATNVMQAVAERQLNAASEDPGTFTLDGSRVWTDITVAIRPGSGGPSAVNLTPLSVAVSAIALDPDPQPVSVTLTPLVVAVSAVVLDPVPQPVNVTLTPLVVTLVAQPLDPQAIGGVSEVNITPVVVSAVAQALDPVPQPVNVDLTPIEVAVALVALGLPVNVDLEPLMVSIEAPSLHPYDPRLLPLPVRVRPPERPSAFPVRWAGRP